MKQIKIKKGLNIPIAGKPGLYPPESHEVTETALLGQDYHGLKPGFSVKEGEKVKLGQELFIDKSCPNVSFTSPASGIVTAINRGEKRKFLSIIIKLDGEETVSFKAFSEQQLKTIAKRDVKQQLLASGQWTALRTRPFGKIPNPETEPHAIFINAMDTNPLAPDMQQVLAGRETDLSNGIHVLGALTSGKLFLCAGPSLKLPNITHPRLTHAVFSGPHPAGCAGTHIHFLNPVHLKRTVWYISAADTAAIGALFTTGRPDMQRIISLAGPSVITPRLLKTRIGASAGQLVSNHLHSGKNRIISGSVLSGRTASGAEAYLGRYHQQITALPEFSGYGAFSWLSPGTRLFSLKNIYLSRFMPRPVFDFTTAAHGSLRAIIPVESYEKVMPLDILPGYLLRALAVDDIDEAEKLGCLELEEEDLALCSFVCPSKIDHSVNLRKNLTLIEKECR